MPRLVIVGNGFDLAHGVRSRYIDFRDHLIQKNPDLYSLIVELSDEDVWSNFEENLANLDLNSLISRLLDEHTSQYDYERLRDNSEGERGARSITRKLDETAQLLICDLESELVQWASGIKDSATNAKFDLRRDDYVISFNYTSTVENLYPVEAERIYYIHKKVSDHYFEWEYTPSSDWRYFWGNQWRLIFGHGSRNTPRTLPNVPFPSMTRDYDVVSAHVTLSEAFNEVYTYFDRSRKPIDEILPVLDNFLVKMEEVDHVLIMGHSLARVDLDYFKMIASRCRSAMPFKISYHGDSKKNIADNALQFLKCSEFVVTDIKNLQLP